MAGTNTIVYEDWPTVKKISMDWLSTAGGDVNSILTKSVSGLILRFVFEPDDGGTEPDDGYTVTCLDEDGLDVFAGDGSGLPGTASVQVIPIFTNGIAVQGTLELVVTGAGNANGGQVFIYMR